MLFFINVIADYSVITFACVNVIALGYQVLHVQEGLTVTAAMKRAQENFALSQ